MRSRRSTPPSYGGHPIVAATAWRLHGQARRHAPPPWVGPLPPPSRKFRARGVARTGCDTPQVSTAPASRRPDGLGTPSALRRSVDAEDLA